MIRLLIMLTALLSLTAYSRSREARLRIIATSDIHGNYLPYDFINHKNRGGGLSHVQTYVRKQAEEHGRERLIILDNGDILQGQPTAYYYNFIDTTSRHFCAEAMNFIGYDAATAGNHDIETGHAVYDRWAEQCHFPLLGANVVNTKTGQPYWKPYTIMERQGLRIAILGLITPGIPKWLPENLWDGMRFEDMAETAKRYMPEMRMREKADIVIGLFHSGTGSQKATGHLTENATLQVAREVPGFDLVICGHDHRETVQHIKDVHGGDVLILNPAADGMKAAEADITVRIRPHKAVTKDKAGRLFRPNHIVHKKVEGRLIDLNDLEPDAGYMARFKAEDQAVRTFTQEVIGHNHTRLSTRKAYFGPSAFVDFIHTLQLRISGADISFCAPLDFDAEIPAGNIRMSDMFNLYKYENMLYVMTLSGQEIKDYLEFSYARWTQQMTHPDDHLLLFRDGAERITIPWQRLKNPCFDFDSAAGLLYTADITKPAGEKITIYRLADGRPFSLKTVYRVAINSYRGGGGGGHLTEGAGIPREELAARTVWSTDKDLRYYLMQTIKEAGNIAPKALNHWHFIPEDWRTAAERRDTRLLFGND